MIPTREKWKENLLRNSCASIAYIYGWAGNIGFLYFITGDIGVKMGRWVERLLTRDVRFVETLQPGVGNLLLKHTTHTHMYIGMN